jgi:hypothetical protein
MSIIKYKYVYINKYIYKLQKQLVTSQLVNEPLESQIFQSTNVMAQHESALIDLSYNSDNETEMEQVLFPFLSFDNVDKDSTSTDYNR